MRALGATTAGLALVLALGGSGAVARADEDPVPSQQDVAAAEAAVSAQADSVQAVRARLAVANQRLEASAVAAAQAAEAYNGARWKAAQARRAARKASTRAAAAEAAVARQRDAYADAVVSSYELSPGLTALAAVVDADGLDAVLEQTTTARNATDAMDANYDDFRAASVVAQVARDQAERARRDADRAARQALAAKRSAQQAADAAAADAEAIAAEKTALIARLAELQHVSVDLAQRRQSALEARAAQAAAAAAEKQAQDEAETEAEAEEQAEKPAEPEAPAADPSPAEPPSATEPPPPAEPPAPRSGAAGAISFARGQLGEPYRWGAAGPDSWDCSGLTMGAWRAGGISLPHYSVAQYEQSTPITASRLQPGDLVFWGSSSDPGSIYHVALYVGGGQIIHAPRTGRPVTEQSMYYWTPPNFYARP